MSQTARIPAGIGILFTIDLALVLASLADYLIGSPSAQLSRWLNLNRDLTLPSWYSSMQWLCAAALFAIVPVRQWPGWPRGMWALGSVALLFLVFSIDEIIGIHEWLGAKSDALLQGGTRMHTAFWYSGIWPLLVGIPVISLFAVLIFAFWRLLPPQARAARSYLIVGLVTMFSGALVVELAANLLSPDGANSGFEFLQSTTEEFLEMVGVTFIVWAGYDFVRAHGFALLVASDRTAAHQRAGSLEAPRTDSSAQERSTPIRADRRS